MLIVLLVGGNEWLSLSQLLTFYFFSLLTKVSFSQQTSALLWFGMVLSHIFSSNSLLHPGGESQ